MNFLNKKTLKSFGKYMTIMSLILIYSCSENESQTVTTMDSLIWEDDFNNTGAVDATKWSYDIGTGNNGWGNNELEYYTNRTENVEVKDGMLHITAAKESYLGASYTSGRILTKEIYDQKYGRFEARIKLPWGKGLWPAFWLLGSDIDTVGWPNCGEIDIMEYVGQAPTVTHGSIHGPNYFGSEAITKSYTLPNDRFDIGFHVFGIEWGENYINYYVDDVLYNQITPNDLPKGSKWVFNDRSFFITLNLAVGGSFVGAPNSETQFPQTMIVDYVKVYK